MQIVIDISDNKIKLIKDCIMFDNMVDIDIYDTVLDAIKNGTPLPKGHGRLIDADETLKAMNTWDKFGYLPPDLIPLRSENGLKLIPYVHYDDMVKCVTNMPSIIEAESEVEE